MDVVPEYETERLPFLLSFEEIAAFKDTYAGEIGRVALHAQLLRPVGRPSRTVAVFMHPTGGGAWLPMIGALAKAGVHTVWCDSRYKGSDAALIMEKVVVDLGNCVKELKGRHGYEKVVLGGWSGGGSLSLFFQAEAERPTLCSTPAGDPPDLRLQQLVPADGITPSHTHQLFDAIGHGDKELHWIQDANHYYFGQPEKSAESARLCVDWMRRKGLLEEESL